MPRFDNEGFNPSRRMDNDNRDRSVPIEENYYLGGERDVYSDFSSGDVVDRQDSVDLNEYINSFDAPQRSARQSQPDFVAEVNRDRDAERRVQNERKVARGAKMPPKKRNKRKRTSRVGKRLIVVVAIILAIVLAISGAINVILGKITYNDKRDNEYVTSSELKSEAGIKNILLLGVDARPDEKESASRSDTMMLITVDTKHRCIKSVSFLRDTWVYIPAIDDEQRLNAACTYDGYDGVVDTIEYNFGVDIDGYVVAGFDMFEVLVDSIGGVEIEVSEAEAKEVTKHPKRYGGVELEAGKQKLNGKQALAYCRIRKIDSDFMRTKRQREVIQSVIKGAKSGNPLALVKMANGSAGYIETNLSKSEIKLLALRAGVSITGDMVEGKVPFDGTWDYANKRGNSVIAINVEKNKEKLIDFIYNLSADEIKAMQDKE